MEEAAREAPAGRARLRRLPPGTAEEEGKEHLQQSAGRGQPGGLAEHILRAHRPPPGPAGTTRRRRRRAAMASGGAVPGRWAGSGRRAQGAQRAAGTAAHGATA